VTRCTHPCQKRKIIAQRVEGWKKGREAEIGLWDKDMWRDKVWTIKKILCVEWANISFLRGLGRIGGLAVLDPAWGNLAKQTG